MVSSWSNKIKSPPAHGTRIWFLFVILAPCRPDGAGQSHWQGLNVLSLFSRWHVANLSFGMGVSLLSPLPCAKYPMPCPFATLLCSILRKLFVTPWFQRKLLHTQQFCSVTFVIRIPLIGPILQITLRLCRTSCDLAVASLLWIIWRHRREDEEEKLQALWSCPSNVSSEGIVVKLWMRFIRRWFKHLRGLREFFKKLASKQFKPEKVLCRTLSLQFVIGFCFVTIHPFMGLWIDYCINFWIDSLDVSMVFTAHGVTGVFLSLNIA